MHRSSLPVALLLVASACRVAPAPAPRAAPPSPAPTPVLPSAVTPVEQAEVGAASAADRDAIDAIVREGTERSRVGQDLQHLVDVIGPRLTGSAGMRRANDWTARKFREYAVDSAWLEPWRFGQAWERGPMTLALIAPYRLQLVGYSWAWAPGTKGPLAGDVVYVDARTSGEFTRRFAGKLAGKWVMTAPPAPVLNPDAAPTSADSAARDSAVRALYATRPTAEEQRFAASLTETLSAERVAGYVRDGAKEFALLTMSGSPARVSPYPYVVVAHESYALFHRLLVAGQPVRLEANITNTLTADSVTVYNTVAEIRGGERPEEVVLLGAHLDSWDLAGGATDNASGSIAVLEAARILRASGVRPRRTIRFALFSGEEQGLYGSAKYAASHAADLPNYQAVLVLDNGTGRITGMALQGRDDLHDAWRALFHPIAALGPFTVRSGTKGGTDHLSFVRHGVPGFNFDQAPRGYDHTHHSQIDSFDHAVVRDVRQAATVMAAVAFQLANLPALLPRNPVAAGAER